MSNVPNLLNPINTKENSFEKNKNVDLSSNIHLKVKNSMGINPKEEYNFIFLEGVLDGYFDIELQFSNLVEKKIMCDVNVKENLEKLLDSPQVELNNDKKQLENSTIHYKNNLKRLKKLIFNANGFSKKFEEVYQEGDEEGLLESKFKGLIDRHGSFRVFSVFEENAITNEPVFIVLLVDPYHMAIPVADKRQKSFDEVKTLKHSIKDIFYDKEKHTKVKFISKEQFLKQFL